MVQVPWPFRVSVVRSVWREVAMYAKLNWFDKLIGKLRRWLGLSEPVCPACGRFPVCEGLSVEDCDGHDRGVFAI